VPEDAKAAHQALIEKSVKILIAATAAVTSTLAGSLFGVGGTLAGVAVGSVVAGISTEAYGYLVERGRHHFKVPRLQFRGRVFYGSVIALVTVVAALISLQLIESATGKPLHAITTGAKQYGSSLGGTSTTPPATPGPALTHSPVPSSSVTVMPTTAVPSPTPTVGPTIVFTPSPTPPPATSSPTSAATVLPTSTATVMP
jgi:hypothetical protein